MNNTINNITINSNKIDNAKTNNNAVSGTAANNNAANNTAAPNNEQEQPNTTQKIGNTTYEVFIRFSETSKETFTDKVLRLIRSDVLNG